MPSSRIRLGTVVLVAMGVTTTAAAQEPAAVEEIPAAAEETAAPESDEQAPEEAPPQPEAEVDATAAPQAPPAEAEEPDVAATAQDGEGGYEMDDPLLLHAQAMAAEADNDPEAAFQLLQQAAELAPEDELIAFDLARLARDRADGEPVVTAFLQRPTEDTDNLVLKGELFAERDQLDQAREQVQWALEREPGHREAQALAERLGMQGDAPRGTARAWQARLGLRGLYDSNVGVLPETGVTDLQGGRIAVDASGVGRLLDGGMRLDVGGALQYGVHANNRVVLGSYDVAALTALASLEGDAGKLLWRLDLTGTEVFLDNFAAHFMQDARLRISGSYRLSTVRFGLFGVGGYRDFVQRRQRGRDGPRSEGGVDVVWSPLEPLSVFAEAAYQAELARARAFSEQGPRGRLGVRYVVHWLTAQLTTDYEWRDHRTKRRDQRLGVQVSGRVPIWRVLGATLSYAWIRSFSNEGFGYERHIAGLGVDTRW